VTERFAKLAEPGVACTVTRLRPPWNSAGDAMFYRDKTVLHTTRQIYFDDGIRNDWIAIGVFLCVLGFIPFIAYVINYATRNATRL